MFNAHTALTAREELGSVVPSIHDEQYNTTELLE